VTATIEPSDLVWYVSYGSNMAAARLACYLEGGCPPGASRRQPGARDATPVRGDTAVELPGTVYFAGESPTWGGGVAFYDPATPGRAAARGYLVTAQQFADIASQEMHRHPDADHDLSEVLETGRLVVGPGRYETMLCVGEREGAPMLTFTAPSRQDHLLAPPSPAYLVMLSQGLRETFGWAETEIADYLRHLPGAEATGGQRAE